MTQQQENVLSMWNTAEAVLMTNEAVWRNLMAFSAAADRFHTIHLELNPNARVQKAAITGITLDKQMLRRQLTDQVIQLAANMQVYATVEQNHTLRDQVSFRPTHFDRMRDSMLPIVVRSLLDTAQLHSAALTDYGVTEAKRTQVEQALSQYENMSTAPRVAIGARKTARSGIAQQIKEGNAQLELLDKLVGNFAADHPEFVAAFRSARLVIPHGNHRTIKDDKDKPVV